MSCPGFIITIAPHAFVPPTFEGRGASASPPSADGTTLAVVDLLASSFVNDI